MGAENTSRDTEECGVLGALDDALLRVARSLIGLPEGALGGMPFAQARCLQVVSRIEGRKMHDLARALEIKLPAVSQIVDRLVLQGLLERRSDPKDRRVTRVWLTRKAQLLLEEARVARQGRIKAALEQIGPEVSARLVADLQLLAETTDPRSGAEIESADPMSDLLAQRARQQRRLAGASSRIK